MSDDNETVILSGFVSSFSKERGYFIFCLHSIISILERKCEIPENILSNITLQQSWQFCRKDKWGEMNTFLKLCRHLLKITDIKNIKLSQTFLNCISFCCLSLIYQTFVLLDERIITEASKSFNIFFEWNITMKDQRKNHKS